MDPDQYTPDRADPRTERYLHFLRFVHHGMNNGGGSGSDGPPYPSDWSLDDPHLKMFRMLARFNVEHNYLGYVLPQKARGKQPRSEGTEDHWLIAALIVEEKGAPSVNRKKKYIESRPSYTEGQEPSKLEDRLIELAEHYDGAIVVDPQAIYPYLKYSGADTMARINFNRMFGHDVQYYSDIEHHHLLPSTFTVASGGKTQTGSRTSTFTSAAMAQGDDVTCHVMKTTTFGNTGVGKVLTLYYNQRKNKAYLYEFFLYPEQDIGLLMHKPLGDPRPHMHFNPEDQVLGIVRHYQTDMDPDVRPQLKQLMYAVAEGRTLTHPLREKIRNAVSDFDWHLTRKTPLEEVLHRCNIDASVKQGIAWALFGISPPLKTRRALSRILDTRTTPHYLLDQEDRMIKDSYERFVKGVMIGPKLVFTRYVSPGEIGIKTEALQQKIAHYLRLRDEPSHDR